MSDSESSHKHTHAEEDVDVGPSRPVKKQKGMNQILHCYMILTIIEVLKFETLYTDHLPSADMYEKSYMHRYPPCNI